LDALDQVPVDDHDLDLSDEDAELYAALDDLPDTFQRPDPARPPAGPADARGVTSADDDFAAALDEWSDVDATNMPTRPSALPGHDIDQAPRRFSAADFDLAEDDTLARSGRRATSAQRARSEAKLASAGVAVARRPSATTSGRVRDYDYE